MRWVGKIFSRKANDWVTVYDDYLEEKMGGYKDKDCLDVTAEAPKFKGSIIGVWVTVESNKPTIVIETLDGRVYTCKAKELIRAAPSSVVVI